jgi:hypothetical protein
MDLSKKIWTLFHRRNESISGGMASLYTRNANREKLAKEAMSKLENENFYTRTPINGKGNENKNPAESKD